MAKQEALSEEEAKKINERFQKFAETKYTDDDYNKIFKNEDKINDMAKKGPLEKYSEYIRTFFSMIKASFSKEYPVPAPTVAMIIGLLLYIFSPIDVILDFIPILGLTDDAAMIALALKVIGGDIEEYKKFLETKKIEAKQKKLENKKVKKDK